ncbi:MAG: carbohydrate ABC transporter permease [Candidatus Zhuqueibacterota bacterium]
MNAFKNISPLRFFGLSLLGLILFLTFFPFVFMFVTSFKNIFQFYHSFWLPSFPLHPENYAMVFPIIFRYIVNSIFVTVLSVLGVVFLGALSGFVFARFSFPGKRLLFYGIIGLMMVPWILTLIPAFMVVKRLNLLDTYWVMILPYISGGQVLAIYIFHSFFITLPEELFESARMDGAGYFQQFWYIGAAMSRPVFGLVAIISSLAVWNNFIWPLVTTTDDKITVLTVGVLRFSVSYTYCNMHHGELFAGYTIASIPLLIIFAIATKQFIRGITAGALKG